MNETEINQTVRRRRVFYIPGYDPFHPRRYRELYRAESAKQAQISGYSLSMAAKQKDEGFGWTASSEMEGGKVDADIDVLVWSDIVRKSMSHSIASTYLQLFQTAWIYITSGTLRRLMWMRKGPVIAALYPVGILLLQLIAAVVAGAVSAFAALTVINLALGLFGWSTGALTPYIRWAVIIPVAYILLRWFKQKDGKIYAHYLMHDYAHSARWKGAYDPELERRLAEFGETIAGALNSDVDEVLVVGHSSGAHLAISILSDLIRAGRVPSNGPDLSLLTLGQVVPMVSFLPKAYRLRADLAYLSTRAELTWVDVTAPGDGCSFALCDPVAVSGVSPDKQRWPLIQSAAFTKTLKPETWKALRWRFFRLHFQYLCAFDQPAHYDYFRITCGPQTLGQRYADRKPSPARIDVPASKHTDLAA